MIYGLGHLPGLCQVLICFVTSNHRLRIREGQELHHFKLLDILVYLTDLGGTKFLQSVSLRLSKEELAVQTFALRGPHVDHGYVCVRIQEEP